MKNFILIMLVCISSAAMAQGFITPLDADDMPIFANNKECIVKLASGEEVTGKFLGGTMVNGYLSNFNIRLDNGEKAKFKPEDVERLSIKASKMAKLAMMAESTGSIKEMTNTNFDEIVNREYLIFETAMRHNKASKLRLMQLLNPGFDSQIKVFADPNAKETTGVGVAGVKLTGGIDKSYLFVQNNEKAVLVKKGSYKKNFEELYAKCPAMLQAFEGEKIKWADVAGHVFAFDQVCK
ncbi:MAG: hypothetical protein KF725_13420 [Cyclobacteriaceae bacterium]|nr:hypothetical protein [Cyclobacteriaceae bacterium]UYN85378.1 MAG: hypothetical protein KIT51_10795 [Cyclobacteriaceae bacterium]